MGPTSDDLRQDIDRKREELGVHVAELGEHVAPGRMARRRWQSVRSSMRGTAESAGDAAAGTTEENGPSGAAIAAASFFAGLVLGIWYARRRYLAK